MEKLTEKWADHTGELSGQAAAAQAKILESQSMYISEATNKTAGIAKFDKVLMSLTKRAPSRLIAFDFAVVQPMKTSTEQLFILKAHATDQTGAELRVNEADTSLTGTGTHNGSDPFDAAYSTGTTISSAVAETTAWDQMGVTVERSTVTAGERRIMATLSLQMIEDLEASHGVDAKSIVTDLLLDEMAAASNREVIRTLYSSAKPGAQFAATPGELDLAVDFNSTFLTTRWRGLALAIQADANAIYTESRIGQGNVLLCSPNVASVLAAAGVLVTPSDTAPESTFVGWMGRIKVFVDPYTTVDFYCISHKGAGFGGSLYFAPYILAQIHNAKNQDSFEPAIGVRSRYGLVGNPFTTDTATGKNSMIRIVKVLNVI